MLQPADAHKSERSHVPDVLLPTGVFPVGSWLITGEERAAELAAHPVAVTRNTSLDHSRHILRLPSRVSRSRKCSHLGGCGPHIHD